jgi:hypothetical protein
MMAHAHGPRVWGMELRDVRSVTSRHRIASVDDDCGNQRELGRRNRDSHSVPTIEPCYSGISHLVKPRAWRRGYRRLGLCLLKVTKWPDMEPDSITAASLSLLSLSLSLSLCVCVHSLAARIGSCAGSLVNQGQTSTVNRYRPKLDPSPASSASSRARGLWKPTIMAEYLRLGAQGPRHTRDNSERISP